MTEPTTAAGRAFYYGNAVKGFEHKLLRDILAIEAEAHEQGMLRQLERQIHDEQQDGSALRLTRDDAIDGWLRLYGGTDTDVAADVGRFYDEVIMPALPPSAPPSAPPAPRLMRLSRSLLADPRPYDYIGYETDDNPDYDLAATPPSAPPALNVEVQRMRGTLALIAEGRGPAQQMAQAVLNGLTDARLESER